MSIEHQMRLDGGADPVRSSRAESFQQAASPLTEAGKDLWQHVPGVATDPEGGKYWRGRQLPMFLSASEIYHHLNMPDQPDDNRRGLMSRKYREASQPARWPGTSDTVDSLLEHLRGRQFNLDRPLPVSYDPNVREYENEAPTLMNGHHRVASALAHMPDKPLPVEVGEMFGPGEEGPMPAAYPEAAESFEHLPRNPTGYRGYEW